MDVPPRLLALQGFAISYLLAFVGFALLVILHEAGHFVVAKAVGMRVERFSLFFPPLIARYRSSKDAETEYAIGAIPLGGYVKITGMSPVEEIPPEVEHRAYYKQKVWKRIAVIVAGPIVNIVLAFLLLWGVFVFKGQVDGPALQATAIQKDGAANGRLQDGDRILSVDGVRGFAPGLSAQERNDRLVRLRARIGAHRCAGRLTDGCTAATPARVRVLRDGRELTLRIKPRYNADAKRMLVGFGFAAGPYKKLGVGKAITESVSGMWRVTTTTVDRITAIFYDSEARKEVSGVVGSYEVTRQSFEFDTVQALQVLALISLSLGIVNLFPFLPLDGGHVFWAIAEKIRGRAIDFAIIERASIVGIMLVLFMAIIGFTNDIGRLSGGEGFGVR